MSDIGGSGWRETAFLASATTEWQATPTPEFLEWLAARTAANGCQVSRIPIADLRGWRVESETGNLVHESGRFFRVEGLEVFSDFGPVARRAQPIINQPEIGIVGFLAQEIGGVLHFLAQAKVEPGNVNLVQLSPTVQATHSNYTQVHGGLRPPYLEYFLDVGRSRIMVDQLQSEQGSRFFRKRNRNMIVRVPADERIDVLENFGWLTLRQFGELLTMDNIVNMDSRSVLSAMRFVAFGDPGVSRTQPCADFQREVLASATAHVDTSTHDFEAVVSWLARMRSSYRSDARIVPLNQVSDWRYDGETIRHLSGRHFSVIGVDVDASGREVGSWQQPLLDSAGSSLFAFLCQRKRGVLHFLVQALAEPGTFDGVEMAPTVQCASADRDEDDTAGQPPFLDLVTGASPGQIRYDTFQSEEGGRFYHDQNRYVVVEVEESYDMDAPSNYLWMTLRQLKEFIRFNNCVNIEARSLVSALTIAAEGPRT
jgi:oxidase EvaA